MIDFNAPPLKDVMKILLRGLDIKNLSAVKPRALKNAAEKNFRTRSLAEVCSPSHLVKFMVDALDDEKLFWQLRVEARCLEPACGEAPFITNRYDAETGEEIPFDKRAGILDKKFRAIPAEADKLSWAYRAVQSVYGFELQDDSLLLARANVLLAFAEFVKDFSLDELKEAANIIAWNFFKFDGMSEPDSFFAPTIVDWRDEEKNFSFGGKNMAKFTFVICNPPYQDDTSGDNKTFAPPVYHHLMHAAKKISEKAVFITPARFLFDAGATPKDFNRQMLNDPHFKVLDYAPDAKIYFRGVEIKGGVVISVYDSTKNFGAIGTFTPYPELNAIHKKICVEDKNFRSLREIIFSRTIYRLTDKMHEDFPDASSRQSKGHPYDMSTNIFALLPEIFFDAKPNDGHEYIQIFGLTKMQRVYKWIRRDYVNSPAPLEKFKVLVADVNSSGALGEPLSSPLIGEPFIGSTESFITVGAFDTREEAEACLKYIKSKFARAMLGILKVTQHNPPATWAKVPLEDFSSGSDIDWRTSVDEQLYRKYNLTAEEISFIETHVKEMS